MTELPRDPKTADIELGLARLGEGLMRHFEPGAERPPCPETDHLDRACVYGEGHDLSVFPHRFEGVEWELPAEEPAYAPPAGPPVELYDQDRRVFAEGTFYGQELTVDVDAESVEGRAISAGSLDGLSIAEPDRPDVLGWLRDRSPAAKVHLVPHRTDEPFHTTAGHLIELIESDGSTAEPDLPWVPPGYALDDAAKLLAQAVAGGMAEVRSDGSDGSGRTIWRVTGLGPNIVHFGQAHVREALERRWLVVGNGGKLQARVGRTVHLPDPHDDGRCGPVLSSDTPSDERRVCPVTKLRCSAPECVDGCGSVLATARWTIARHIDLTACLCPKFARADRGEG